tara:strand:- start:3145 stop:3351 length:207 start_codon:yes stop_codon:yes gene_type:complete
MFSFKSLKSEIKNEPIPLEMFISVFVFILLILGIFFVYDENKKMFSRSYFLFLLVLQIFAILYFLNKN